MDTEVIEDCLQRAAELSTVWAVVREQDADAWIVVLEDETLLDIEVDRARGQLLMRTELGQITHAETRAIFNDLLVRCASAFELPRIGMSTDHRYELLACWDVDSMQIDRLATHFNEITRQAQAWREIVARPVSMDSSGTMSPAPMNPLTLKA